MVKRRIQVIGAVAMTSLLASGSAYAHGASSPEGPPAEEAREVYAPLDRSDWTIQPGPFGDSLDDQSPASDVMAVVADRIHELGVDRGFVRQQTDYEHRSIAVLWKGEPPADVFEYIAARPLGVEITLTEGARYSRSEVETARTRVLNSELAAELRIAWTDLNDDGSGLTIGVESRELTSAELTHLRAIAGIEDVDVKIGAEPAPLFNRPID